jgi:hypothetical protein
MPKAVAGSAHHRHEQIIGSRRVVREIWTADAAGIDFPSAKQVFRIRRSVYDLSGHRISKDIVHGITSLDADRATSAHLLALVLTGHQQITSTLQRIAADRTRILPSSRPSLAFRPLTIVFMP